MWVFHRDSDSLELAACDRAALKWSAPLELGTEPLENQTPLDIPEKFPLFETRFSFRAWRGHNVGHGIGVTNCRFGVLEWKVSVFGCVVEKGGVVMGESEGRRPVWAVSHGEYSGYRILFLCESRELAEAEVAALKADEDRGYYDPFVEEMVLFSRPTVVMPVYRFFAEIRDATGVVKEWRNDSSEREEAGYERLIPCSWRWVRAPMYKGLGGRLEVMGTDEKLCRKVYGEKRALLVADAVFRGQVRVEGVAGRRKGVER